MIEAHEKEKELPSVYEEVLALIPEGAASPITVSTISNLTGLSGTVVRQIVHNLILDHGYKIATSSSGYYMITNDEERDQTVRNLMSRATKIMKRARVIKGIPDENQMELRV